MTHPSDPDTASAISELAGLLMSTDSFEQLLQGLAELSVRAVGGARTCGITLAQDGRVLTVASADALATLLDVKQYEHDEGPCLQALHTGEIVDAPDLTDEDRWHGYPLIAIWHGIRAVLSTPLMVADKPVGVLNLYATEPHAFSAQDRRLIGVLAEQSAIAVTAALRHYDDATLSDHLRTALSSRSTIDQAIGIIIERHDRLRSDRLQQVSAHPPRQSLRPTDRHARRLAADPDDPQNVVSCPFEASGLTQGISRPDRHVRHRAHQDDREPQPGDAGENRNRRPCGSGRQHELEQRHRVAQSLLQRAERAVAVPDHQCHTLSRQRGGRDPKQPATAAGQRTPPDVGEARQLGHGDHRVGSAEPSACGPHAAPVISARKNSPSSWRSVPHHQPARSSDGIVIPPNVRSAVTVTPNG
jgi:GAF domain-containing protein